MQLAQQDHVDYNASRSLQRRQVALRCTAPSHAHGSDHASNAPPWHAVCSQKSSTLSWIWGPWRCPGKCAHQQHWIQTCSLQPHSVIAQGQHVVKVTGSSWVILHMAVAVRTLDHASAHRARDQASVLLYPIGRLLPVAASSPEVQLLDCAASRCRAWTTPCCMRASVECGLM